jgi:hypothetical protein
VAADSAQVKGMRWAKRVEAWERSGQSQRAWCKAEGVSLSTFKWWRQRLAKEVLSERVPNFMPLRLEPEATTASIEVRLRSGTHIRFEGEAALRAVEPLLRGLR